LPEKAPEVIKQCFKEKAAEKIFIQVTCKWQQGTYVFALLFWKIAYLLVVLFKIK
jgi:hypothetical protein